MWQAIAISIIVPILVLYECNVTERRCTKASGTKPLPDNWVYGHTFFATSAILAVCLVGAQLILPSSKANIPWNETIGYLLSALGVSGSIAMYAVVTQLRESLLSGQALMLRWHNRTWFVTSYWQKFTTNTCGMLFLSSYLFVILYLVDQIVAQIGG
ncbi:MAG: hypothetical protein FJ004_02775 [Chloroflexi bacterium]|nr:hypothetical protein [Chloroflexota bacterium]